MQEHAGLSLRQCLAAWGTLAVSKKNKFREQKGLFCLQPGGLSQRNLCAGAALLHMAKRGEEGKAETHKAHETPAEMMGRDLSSTSRSVQTFMLNPMSAAVIRESHHSSKAWHL